MKHIFKKGHELSFKPVTIRGVEYPSRKIAAEVLGVTTPAITGAEKRGSLDTVGLRIMGRRPKDD